MPSLYLDCEAKTKLRRLAAIEHKIAQVALINESDLLNL